MSRRLDYAQDVPVPSGLIVPPTALQDATSDEPIGLAVVHQLFSCKSVTLPPNQFIQRLIDALSSDPIAKDQRASSESTNSKSKWSWSPEGLLLHDNLVYIPQDDELRLELLRMHHDDPLAGYFSIAKTFELLSCNYWFLRMHSFIKAYVDSCDVCSHAKVPRYQKNSEFALFPIPSSP